MDALFLLLPISLLFVLGIGVAFWWAIFAGQFDDAQEAGMAIFRDDDAALPGTSSQEVDVNQN
ncbi:cbb3-type cytochrome oxidase assembly protein CcoS [Castellaniella sp. FW104-16D08]|jgi:cbb3-type cytochrome oxidase maturation protein|uniref:cbb3-type cytochrome oxidase assembly protein CcoS n=1 Tax=unclassified Castellaniella TaxID=2617606 RepID=UPI003314BC53